MIKESIGREFLIGKAGALLLRRRRRSLRRAGVKKTMYLSLLLALTAFSCRAAIVQDTVRYGSSVTLTVPDDLIATGTSIQWQYSTNLTNWTNAPSATNKKYTFTSSTTRYYRALLTTNTVVTYSDTTLLTVFQLWSGATSKLNGGRCYAEPFVENNVGLSNRESGNLTNWTNSNRKAVWFVYQPAAVYDFGFILSLTNNAERSFKLTCTRTDGTGFDPLQQSIDYKGNGRTDTLYFFKSVNMPTGYYRYELESVTTTGTITVSSLLFNSYMTAGQTAWGTSSGPHTTDYLSSPSVHLNYSSQEVGASGNNYDWIYQEVLVPENYAPIYTYWEAIGFTGGYLGLQANYTSERRILFSVWDQIDADYYKRIGRPLPPDSLVSLVDKAPYVTSNSFGGEGTGGQSYFANAQTWKENYPVKFLFNVRRETVDCATCPSGTKPTVILSAWYCAYEPDEPGLESIPDQLKGWRYIASWRRPFVNSWQSGNTNSFIENFGWSNGQIIRKGYYYNTYGHHVTQNRWLHFNGARGTNTDGASGQRVDFEHGISTDPGHTDKFYMLSAGYGARKASSGTNYLPLKKIEDFPYLRDLNLQAMIDRVDEALEAEKIRNGLDDLLIKDKSGWSVKYYSSQETSGEGAINGRAATIIDGNSATYWHSAWASGIATYPHILVFDLGKEENIQGFAFTLSDGSRRWMKNINIGMSDTFSGAITGVNTNATNDANWRIVWSGDAPNESKCLLKLDRPAKGRYVRVKIMNGWNDSDGVHTRINEFDVLPAKSGTAIEPVRDSRSIVNSFFYTLQGIHINKPLLQGGIYLRKDIYASGETVATKVLIAKQ